MLLPSWTVTNAVNFLPAVFDVTARNTTRSSTSTYMTCTAQMNDRTKGLLIILAGVLCVSPDAVLVRFLSEGGADPWTIIFWKLLLSIPVSASYAIYEAGGLKSLWKSVIVGRWYYAAAIPIQATVDICFTLSFVYTSAANALLLINLNPLWCAVVGRFCLGDALPRRTYIALVLALLCMIIIFVPEVVERKRNDDGDDSNTNGEEDAVDGSGQSSANTGEDTTTRGNIIALVCGFLLAAYITIVRKGGKSSKNINMIGAAALGALLSSVISLIVRRGDVLPASFWDDAMWKYWLAAAGQGFGIGAVFVAISIAPRLISGAEVGLCVLLEVVLGPLFVFLAYRDVPSKWTLIGGSLLLTVLAVHESRPLFDKAKDMHRSLSRQLSRRMGSTVVAAKEVGVGGSSIDKELPEEEGEKAAAANEEDVEAAGPEAAADSADGGVDRVDTWDEDDAS